MKLEPLRIDGAWVAESPVWSDERGFFREWFKYEEVLNATGLDFSVAQANVSLSNRGVVRGIHYSLAEGGQAKWVTCVSGSVLDVVVDIRVGSPTFGKWESVVLGAGDEVGRSVLIGPGLGHGFIALEAGSAVSYLLTSVYSPSDEFEINPLDPEIGIAWGLSRGEMKLSPKDEAAPLLNQRKSERKLPKFNAR